MTDQGGSGYQQPPNTSGVYQPQMMMFTVPQDSPNGSPQLNTQPGSSSQWSQPQNTAQQQPQQSLNTSGMYQQQQYTQPQQTQGFQQYSPAPSPPYSPVQQHQPRVMSGSPTQQPIYATSPPSSQPTMFAMSPPSQPSMLSSYQPSTSVMGGQPSISGAQPSVMGGQPSVMGSQPSVMGGQPSTLHNRASSNQLGGQPSVLQAGGSPSVLSNSYRSSFTTPPASAQPLYAGSSFPQSQPSSLSSSQNISMTSSYGSPNSMTSSYGSPMMSSSYGALPTAQPSVTDQSGVFVQPNLRGSAPGLMRGTSDPNLVRAASLGTSPMSPVSPLQQFNNGQPKMYASTPELPLYSTSPSSQPSMMDSYGSPMQPRATIGGDEEVSMTGLGGGFGVKGSRSEPGTRDVVRDGLVYFSKNFQIVIKGGTLDKLVERLSAEHNTDSDYVDNFLLTYRNFITPADMLQKLFERYESGMETVSADDVSDFEAGSIEKKKKIVRLRVGNVIKRWVSDHFHDFFADPSLLAALEGGLEKIQERGLVDSIKKLVQEQRVAKEKSTKKEAMFSTPPPSSVVPKTSKFEDFDIVECARQICLLEQEIYARIHPKEALNQNWNKRREQAPNIIAMITFFNQLSKWVSTKIVSVAELKPRSKLLKKFIQLLIKLREYNNFDAMQAVLAGLSNSAVYRLKQTWAKAQKEKFWAQFEECQTLMDSHNNFSNFRDAVQHADPPIIPYLGVYLTDLTFIEDGNNSSLPVADGRTDIINFEKMRKVAVVIKDICTYQQTPYNFNKVDIIYNFFKGPLEGWEDGPLFKKSREVEPPTGNNPEAVQKKNSFFRKLSFSGSGKDKEKDKK